MDKIVKVLKSDQITDIFQLGLANIKTNEVELITDYRTIFLEFGNYFLKFESVQQSSRLRISQKDCIQFDATEEELPPFKYSVKELILVDDFLNNHVISIDIYGEFECIDGLICEAFALKLECGQEIFFDPTFYFGLSVGGAMQKEKWLNNYPNMNSPIDKHSITL